MLNLERLLELVALALQRFDQRLQLLHAPFQVCLVLQQLGGFASLGAATAQLPARELLAPAALQDDDGAAPCAKVLLCSVATPCCLNGQGRTLAPAGWW